MAKWTGEKIDGMLKSMVDRRASDIHLKVGNNPVFRIDGKLVRIEDLPVLTAEDIDDIAYHILPYSKKGFVSAEGMGEECGYDAEGIGRFRVSIFRQRGVLSIVMRHIPSDIPLIDNLNLPPVIKDLAMERRGLILVTGTTGSGKSTTLAAMIEHINLHESRNIITIEDPIEFLFTDKKSIIAQREIGTDVENFANALKASLRQDPDVILVGEMRDLETIETAILAFLLLAVYSTNS
jgi:twitching motility protein PilT